MGAHRDRRTPEQTAAKKAALLACLAANAANGKVCPSINQFARLLGINANIVYDLLTALRAEKAISWQIVYCGTGLGKVRIVTIARTGQTTARPAMVKRPRGSLKHAKAERAELERAKTALRRFGHIVFDAEIDGGPRGMIKVDRDLLRPAEVVLMAQQTGAL